VLSLYDRLIIALFGLNRTSSFRCDWLNV